MSYAWRHGLEFTLPHVSTHPRNNPIYLQHLVNPKWNPRLPEIKIKEQGHRFQQIPFREEWRKCNIILDGYWQSEKYFKEFRAELLAAMAIPWTPRPGTVSFHVRRGDYLTLTKKHPPVSEEWRQQAMAMFLGAKFIFFSDDIPWCKATYGHRDDCSFSAGHSEVDDLMLMSCCEHHICSASTFSWWGAWLNRNPAKRVVIPSWWFSPEHTKATQTDDIVPEDWIRIP